VTEEQSLQHRNATASSTLSEDPPSPDILDPIASTHPAATEETVITPATGWTAIGLSELWRYRELIYFLAWRDLKVKYKQTVIGAAWAVVQPIMTMLVFTVIFGRVAKIDSLGYPYGVFAFSALVPWTYFALGVTQTANSLVGNSALIAKIYFPRLAVPIASALAGIVDFLISFVVLMGMAIFYDLMPSIRLLSVPFFLLLAAITALGVGLTLSAINVKFRDVRYLTGFIVQFWMWASPVVYPSTLIEDPTLRLLYHVNPMVAVIDGFRWAVLGADVLSLPGLAISIAVATTLLITGAFFFKRMERTFADVA
jgi:lipopolysaccharide transport system permease protein